MEPNTLVIVMAHDPAVHCVVLCHKQDMPPALREMTGYYKICMGDFCTYTAPADQATHAYNRRIRTALEKRGTAASDSQIREIEAREKDAIDFVRKLPQNQVFDVAGECSVLTLVEQPVEAYDRSDDYPLLEEIVRSVVA